MSGHVWETDSYFVLRDGWFVINSYTTRSLLYIPLEYSNGMVPAPLASLPHIVGLIFFEEKGVCSVLYLPSKEMDLTMFVEKQNKRHRRNRDT